MKKLALIIAISLVMVLVASAQTKSADATVFGLHLGAKFSLPECARSTTGDAGVLNYDYRSEPSFPCFQLTNILMFAPSNTPLLNDQNVKIHFPTSMLATMSLDLHAQIVDGNLEGVQIHTHGLESQDEVLASLKAKYGEPSEFQEKQEQNAMGAVFNCHAAAWSFDNLTVVFFGALGHTDAGLVNIETTKESALIKKWRDESQARTPKM
jgi:hypothetical protein